MSKGGCSSFPLPWHCLGQLRCHLPPAHPHWVIKAINCTGTSPWVTQADALFAVVIKRGFLRLSPCNTTCWYAYVLITWCYISSINLLCLFICSDTTIEYCLIWRNKPSHFFHLLLTTPLWIDPLLPPLENAPPPPITPVKKCHFWMSLPYFVSRTCLSDLTSLAQCLSRQICTLLLVNFLPSYKERAQSRRIPRSASAQQSTAVAWGWAQHCPALLMPA